MYGEKHSNPTITPIITVNEYPDFQRLQEGFSNYHEETHQQIAQRS